MQQLHELMASQSGAFTAAQARDAGMTRHTIAATVRSRTWRPLAKGVFVERAQWGAMSARQRHLCLVHARLLVLADGWVAARESAAIAHGLPLLGSTPARPRLVRPDGPGVGASSSRFERVAPVAYDERVTASSTPSCSLARTAVDLARELAFRSSVVVTDAVLRRGVSPDELAAVAARQAGWRGHARVGRVLDFANGLAETPLESVSRVGMHLLGLPTPQLQVEIWVGDRFLARVDNAWPELGVVGEADGVSKYGSPRDLYDEKVRQEGMEDVGLVVFRWGWDDAWRPRGVLDARFWAAVTRAKRRAVDPGVRFVPTTVGRPLRHAA